jgi:hypothetical protein
MSLTPRLSIANLDVASLSKEIVINANYSIIDAAVVRVTGDTMSGGLKVQRTAATSGTPAQSLWVAPPTDTGLTASVEAVDVQVDGGSKTFAAGALALQRSVVFTAQTYAFASASTITAAATVHINGNPIVGTNATITNGAALHVQGRVCFGDNIATANNAAFVIAPGRASTQQTALMIMPTNTGNMTASTESNLTFISPNGTVTWATGNFANQRENRFLTPTYAAVGASVITNAATVGIGGAPIAGANMTLTNSYALWIVGGGLRATGHVVFDGGSVVGAAAGANAGGSPPAPVVTANGNDTRGNITFGTGSAPAAGALVAVTFAAAYSAAATPVVMVVPRNTATQALGLYISAVSTTGFTLSTTNAPAAGQANTVYSFDFLVMG